MPGCADGGPAASAGPKRKRPMPAPPKKQGAVGEALPQQLLGLLSRMGAPRRKGASAASVAAQSVMTHASDS